MTTEVINPQEPTTTESIAQTLLPYYTEDGKKPEFLKYIIAGFSKMEAAKLCGLGKYPLKTIHRWEEDPVFMALLEKSRTTLRDELANKLVDIEFTRNFMLTLKKDFKVMMKDAMDETLTEQESAYLTSIRKFYTPQQYAVVKQLASGGGDQGEAFNFTKQVLEIRLTKETNIR